MLPEPGNKQKILSMLLAQHGTERRIWESLGEEHRSRMGEIDAWSVKDHIAHVTYWREIAAQRVRAAATGGEATAPDEDFLATNDAVFSQHNTDAWEVVLGWAYSVQDELIEEVEALDEDRLTDPDRFKWTNGRPLWQHIALGEGFHPYSHLCDLLIQSDDFEAAENLQLDLYKALAALDDSEHWQGDQAYNLACFYALHSRPDRAVALLEESFVKNPGLMDWSIKDSDLNPLRNLPEFKALFTI